MTLNDAIDFVYIPVSGENIYASDNLMALREFAREDNYFCATCDNRFLYALVNIEGTETLMHIYFNEDTPSIKEKYIKWKYIERIYPDREIIRI